MVDGLLKIIKGLDDVGIFASMKIKRIAKALNPLFDALSKYVDIIGIPDRKTQEIDMPSAYYRTQLPRIAISHNPDVYYDIIDRTSMIFAGHTHGGQFVLPFMRPLFVPSKYGAKFASGLITPERNQMIISKGLGTSILPVRLNCKPEIVIVDFVAR